MYISNLASARTALQTKEHVEHQRSRRRQQAADARRLDVDCLLVVVRPHPNHSIPQIEDHDCQQRVTVGKQSSRERHQASPHGLADPKEVASAGVELGLGGNPPELRDESVADVDDRLPVRVDHLHCRRVRDQLNVGPLGVGEHSVAESLTNQSLSEGVQSDQGARREVRRAASVHVGFGRRDVLGVAWRELTTRPSRHSALCTQALPEQHNPIIKPVIVRSQ